MNDINIPDTLPGWIKEHVTLYLQNGEAGHYWDASLGGGEGMLTTLLLTTRGRKSGKQLILPLIYRPTDTGGYCVIASKGGAPAHPAWYLNLEADPNIHIQVATEKFDAVAREAQGEEREKLWQIMVNYYSPYTDYQAATQRQIPVVVLDPV
ncbi:MAG: nitroreductase family deazaflavin-dependent oxidoreductase [Gammaproteobacteria bacterium]|nr:MAG: nitroreductase family deazaflavin-dependent oxidoreductase [Gammaproteobacteria bacterium]